MVSVHETWEKAETKMIYNLDCVISWQAANKLFLNVSRTVYMSMRVGVPANANFKIDDNPKRRVE